MVGVQPRRIARIELEVVLRGRLRREAQARFAAQVVPTPREISILRLLSEQVAVPLDQLARFLDCDEDRAQRLAEHLCDAKFTRRAQLLAGEPDWIWLSEGGTRLSRTGFKSYLPAPGALARRPLSFSDQKHRSRHGAADRVLGLHLGT